MGIGEQFEFEKTGRILPEEGSLKLRDFFNDGDKYIIYCDMDGVLCDFLAEVENTERGLLKKMLNGKKKEKDEVWDKINARGEDFWANMKWLSDGKELWKYIKPYDPWILSAAGRNKDSIINGKMKWIKRELGGDQTKGSIIVHTAKSKKNYAVPNGILIDDDKRNISDWIGNGGIGIHHTNTKKTLKELKKIMGEK